MLDAKQPSTLRAVVAQEGLAVAQQGAGDTQRRTGLPCQPHASSPEYTLPNGLCFLISKQLVDLLLETC